jgi:hypothetical protein
VTGDNPGTDEWAGMTQGIQGDRAAQGRSGMTRRIHKGMAQAQGAGMTQFLGMIQMPGMIQGQA